VAKVIQFTNRKSKNGSENKESDKKELSFEEIAKRNKENQERIERERAKSNKSTLRSYRIK
jgi:hypothetical protein